MTSLPLLGFDPGRDKCGLAVIDTDGRVQEQAVVPTAEVISTIRQFLHQYNCRQIILGNQTASRQWQQRLEAEFGSAISIALVDERHSSLAARDRYWQLYPPRGLMKLIPQGMRTPPRPIDDIVAILLVERYLSQGS